jgi:acyl carrier protein
MNTKKKIFKVISIALEVEESVLSEDTSIGDFPNWDSMGHLIIISELEKEFDIKFDPEDMMEFEDIGDMIEAIEGYTNI